MDLTTKKYLDLNLEKLMHLVKLTAKLMEIMKVNNLEINLVKMKG